jgi:DNA polymerase
VPENEHDLWQLDQMLNAYGVAVDKELIDSALYCDEVTTNQLMQEAASITKLDNPKSPTQVKKWLSDELDEEVTSLTKESVKDLLKLHNDETITRVLEIRQELAKTSTKKYLAMDKAVCNDGRIRGLLQIYGANRTGRWAGRLVQVHNLPQNHLPVIEWARDSIKARRIDDIKAIYGNIPDTLSQLIRTAFIPSPGYVLIPADFSAIEARIIAWLAGEQWRLDVFATHGKIYEASAAAMFGVPVESIKKGDPLRQKGKVAELACIAEGQLVLTDIGLVPIEKVTTSMLIWDGEEFVSHDGAMFRGIKEVITYDGLTATADHLVWIEGETRPIRFDKSAASGARLKRPAINWADIRKCGNNQPGKKMENRLERSLRINKMPQLWKYPMDALLQFATRKVKGLSALLTTKTNTKMVRPKIYSSKTALHKSKGRKLLKLWRAWNSFLLQLRTRSRFMDDRELRTTRERIGNRPDQYKWQLRAGKPSLGNTSNKLCQSAPVYDIINCGPRNRYTVNGALVHNCGYQGSIGALKAMGADKMGLSDEELKQIIYRWRQANKRIVDLWYTVENAALSVMKTGQPAGINKGIIIARESDSQNGQDFLTIRLLSGRKLYYVRPFIQPNDFGRESLNYWGLNQETKKWQVMETYGGKLVENIVQAIARDCLAVNLQRITEAGYKAPFHVHDEIITEAPENEAEKHLDYICNLMGQPIAWAPGLLLRADGFVTKFYMKEG